MIDTIVPLLGGDDYSTDMCFPTLDACLMRAGDVLIHHGEHIPVLYLTREGELRQCRLLRRGQRPRTVQLAIWTEHGRRIGNRDVRFEEVLLPPVTAMRLYQVAYEQEQLCLDDLPGEMVAFAVAGGMLPDVTLSEGSDASAHVPLQTVLCSACGLLIATFEDPTLPPMAEPVSPVHVEALGCLCTLRPSWLRALLEDAQAGVRRDYGWQGRLQAALAIAGLNHHLAAKIVDDVVPLRAELVTWAKARLRPRR
jgi:hypothetical protein